MYDFMHQSYGVMLNTGTQFYYFKKINQKTQISRYFAYIIFLIKSDHVDI